MADKNKKTETQFVDVMKAHEKEKKVAAKKLPQQNADSGAKNKHPRQN